MIAKTAFSFGQVMPVLPVRQQAEDNKNVINTQTMQSQEISGYITVESLWKHGNRIVYPGKSNRIIFER